MANLYFNAAIDYDWNTLGNWWEDDGYTIQATSLPSSGDTVYINNELNINTGSTEPLISDLYVDTLGGYLWCDITVTNTAIIYSGTIYRGTLTANPTFYGENQGTINGSAVFDNYGINSGTVQYDATFYGYAYNCGPGCSSVSYDGQPTSGLVNGNAQFYDNSVNSVGTINGSAEFYGYSSSDEYSTFNGGVSFYEHATNNTLNVVANFYDYASNYGVSLDGSFYDYSTNNVNIDSANFYNNSENYGDLSASSSFYDYSINRGTFSDWAGTLTFNNNSINLGVVSGNAIFNDSSSNYDPISFDISNIYTYGVIQGAITCNTINYCPYPPKIMHFFGMDGDWDNINNWFLDFSGTIQSGSVGFPAAYDSVEINSNLTMASSTPTVNNVNIYGGTTLNIPMIITSTLSADSATIEANITAYNIYATGFATLGSSSVSYTIDATNDIQFYDTSSNYAILNSNYTNITPIFNISSVNFGVIGSDQVIFNGSSSNSNTIQLDATFNNNSYNNWGGIVTGNAIFNHSSYNLGYLNTATFNTYSFNVGVIANESGTVFNGLSGTTSYIDFNNSVTVTSEFFNGHHVLYWDGVGAFTYNWSDSNAWKIDTSKSMSVPDYIPAYYSLPQWYHAVRVDNECSYNSDSTPPVISALFVDSTYFRVPIVIGNSDTRNGSATFSGSSNIGSYGQVPYFTLVYGSVTFNDYSVLDNGIYYGDDIIFNDNTYIDYFNYAYPFENGTITFNDYSYNEGNIGSSSSMNQTITFNNDSYNGTTGYVNVFYTGGSQTIFNDRSWNIGNVNDGFGNTLVWNGLTGINAYGDRFTGGQYNPSQAVTFYFNAGVSNDWSGIGSWWFDLSHTIPASILPTSIDDAVLSNPVISNAGSEPTIANLLVLGSNNAYLGIPITITGLATFDGNGSYNASFNTITGNALFNGSINYGIINGNANFENYGTNQNGTITGITTFDLFSAETMIRSGYDGTYGGSGDVRFKYEKGVNGSSILGLV